MRATFRTLRFRISLWYAILLSVVLLAFGGLTHSVVRYQVLRHHDEEMETSAADVQRVLSQQEDCEHLTPAQQAELDQIGRLVLFHEMEGERRVLYRSPDISREAGVADDRIQLSEAPSTGRFETVPGASGLVRRYSMPYRSRAGRRGVIHVIEGLGDVEHPLTSLRLAFLLMAPLAVLVSAASAYWLARRALAPVDEVTRTAREIEASRLGQRLPAPRVQDEIGRLIDTFNQMIARLESSFESMKRFTADASHELRAPLATMRGAIDVALSRPREAAEYRDVLASVGDDVDRLRAIVGDLLVLARADAGRIALEKSPVRLDVITAEVAESFRATAAERGIHVATRCSTPVVVLGDERWLRQLVFNLVDNAIKFSAPARPTATVAARVSVEDAHVTLSVADSGPGIPEEALGRIFERFFRADTARASSDGFGLGLAIAAWIVQVHGGRIAVENRPEGGCIVSVTLIASGSLTASGGTPTA
jgi:heavy metal sensor kinase